MILYTFTFENYMYERTTKTSSNRSNATICQRVGMAIGTIGGAKYVFGYDDYNVR